MILPYILDVAIGLIFIYLILSLLASEIQELISTIFQWRADHLKKSIENLLSGEGKSYGEARVINLANRIYNNPLITNINQEAKGGLTTLPRKLTWVISSLYRSIKNPRPGTKRSETVFGENKRSGPSYIPSETFATTLLETLQIPFFIHKLTESRLDKLKNERLLKPIQDSIENLKYQTHESNQSAINSISIEFEKLVRSFNKISEDFISNKTTLRITIERMSEKLDTYITNCQAYFTEREPLGRNFIYQIESLKEEVFGNTPESIKAETAILLAELKPSLTEIVEALEINSTAYREIEATIQDKDSPTYRGIEEAILTLPDSVRESLAVLAKRAESKVESTEEDLNQLRQEIEVWFDRSMERASGVYKRNAKGVAILIGVLLAGIANADTFHIINRLSKDSAIRNTLTQNAGQIVTYTGNNSIEDLNDLRKAADEALTDIALPIGWTPVNLQQQIGWNPEQEKPNPFSIINFFRMLPGWILSGFAIAMGAPFWFDLLGKFTNVRNTGKRPISTARNKSADQNQN